MTQNTIESILNNLGGTAIYVIRQDDHRILYFNDRVKEVTPNARVGSVCHELWAGTCGNCPLPGLEGKDRNNTINYDDPFGEVVDISASKMMWEDKIPAVLVSVTPHVLTETERRAEERRNHLAAAALKVYGLIISVDLCRNTYEIIGYNERCWLPEAEYGRYDDLLELGVRFTHPFYSGVLRETFDRENALRVFADGKRELQLELRQKDEDNVYHWMNVMLLHAGDTSDSGKAILMLSQIDSRKRLEQEWEAFNAGVTTLFGECMLLDLEDGTYTTAKFDNSFPEFPVQGDFDSQNIAYCNALIHPDDREMFREAFSLACIRKSVADGEKIIVREMRRLTPDGIYRWTEMIGVLVTSAAGEERTMVLTFRDVDDVRREEERKRNALLDALNLAEQANNAKSDFLSRMSHDIRTPMNAIIGMASIAEANIGDLARTEDCIHKIQTSAGFLLSLINDILDMSKIESGKMTINRESFDLYALVREMEAIIDAQAREKNQRFSVLLPAHMETEYYGDSLRLNQVLMNLLSNAVKYTPEGGKITLRINEDRKKGKKSVIRFEVEDNGIGMSEEFLNHIYEPFKQDGNTGEKGQEGTGLGLSIARNLVHLMGGSISISSEPGRGSCFTVELPFVEDDGNWPEASAEEKKTEEPEKPLGSFEGKRLLIVEDNPLNMEIAEILFGMEGFEIESEEDGESAVRRFAGSAEGYYDMILMDVRMPVMDGLEATRTIRKLDRPDAAAIPILAMTANAFTEDVKATREAGMNGHLAKPLEMEVVLREIRKFL
ncbi:PAS domain-containing hybrid sensor histidine kinase/response regulator [Eubacterium sp. 1001713B170207_170306_E7]|uniref:PAS domain-containing hybrid sensor histidine kinase/response regulator n=1 Tax=Eubacterium sp. 1001713B170207_170306_E7 TaxID=2787097 RepID=UPI00189840C4|nr:PAS domain-containing hybrid sensor histidine kinase/response regulator [Eubacterium sp. 1001713B170207_170306_E7]